MIAPTLNRPTAHPAGFSMPDDDVHRLRLALIAQGHHLCRIGATSEWLVLGFPGSPSMKYAQGLWVTACPAVKSLIIQTLGKKALGVQP